MSNQNTHTQMGSSVSAFVSTLVPVILLTSALFVAFLILRKRYPRVYQPRTYLGALPEWQRSPEQSKGFLGWRREYTRLKDEHVMGHSSLDNYLWIRYLRMLATMCFVGCIITWPILFPVNATGGGGQDGLDILSFSNTNPGVRYYAQVFVSWIFLAWVMFLITRESRFFTRLRQHYYLSPYMSSLISSKTVLFTNVPEDQRTERHMRETFGHVRSVWFSNVSDDLAQQVEDRDAAATKLESGEVALCRNYTKRQQKNEKKGSDHANQQQPDVIEKDRPTHRLPKLKFLPIGKKVDTIDWSRNELHHLVPEVAQAQRKLKESSSERYQGACFIEFETVGAAYAAMHQRDGLKSKKALTPKEFAPSPDTVIWKNITKSYKKVQSLNLICTAFIWFLCIFWSIPVAVIGAISNINYLTTEVPFLSFINQIPDVILGVVTGLLPVVLLAVLMILVPIICALLAKMFEPTQGAVQLKVQAWYFPFQVIQVFLVTTFASGAASVAAQIVQTPTTAPSLLAKNLPKASNFYISYFILQGLLIGVLQLLSAVPLLMFLIVGKFLDKTPRKLYNRFTSLGGLSWGSTYAKFANLGVIALSYSSISPLILGFAAAGFTLMYLAYRYNVLFTLGTQVSTRGASYAKGLQQLIVGIYLSEVCLIGLFAIGVGNSVQSVGPLVLEIALLIATIAWHIWLKRSISKLEKDIPEQRMEMRSDANQNGDLEKSGNGYHPNTAMQSETDAKAPALSGPEHRSSWMARAKGFLYPDTSAANAAWLVSSCLSNPRESYSQEEHDQAFLHPAAYSECPEIWIAKDKYGVSNEEITATHKAVGEGIHVTDENAWIDEKAKVQWSEETRSAPIYEKPVAY